MLVACALNFGMSVKSTFADPEISGRIAGAFVATLYGFGGWAVWQVMP